MLFLLNDVVFDLDEAAPVTPGDARRFESLELDYVLELGCELFSEDPLLHLNDPQRARRLAWLIHDRSPEVNAALFAAQLLAAGDATLREKLATRRTTKAAEALSRPLAAPNAIDFIPPAT